MPLGSRTKLDQPRITEIAKAVAACAADRETARAWELAAPLLRAQAGEPLAALSLAHLVGAHCFESEQGMEVLRMVFAPHTENAEVVAMTAAAFESVHDFRYLNAAPPQDELATAIARKLQHHVEQPVDATTEEGLQAGLAGLARMLGRAWDSVAEGAHRRLVELKQDWQSYYDLGLFLKTRGRFAEGVQANHEAAARGGADNDSVQWNLGICATGAGLSDVALAIWKRMGSTIELGEFGLPQGRYGEVKVRLAQRPLAERDLAHMSDDPGLEETIWVERLSPCHGIVRSVLFQELGVDYGDVVLFDGAPITHHTYGETSVPVFPHLATLVRRKYRRFAFEGTQQSEGQLASLSAALPGDAVLYVHTEQKVDLCHACWENAELNHAEHSHREHRVVRGKLSAPPSLEPAALLRALDAALAAQAGTRVYAPELCRAAGAQGRADVEQRRFDMLQGS